MTEEYEWRLPDGAVTSGQGLVERRVFVAGVDRRTNAQIVVGRVVDYTARPMVCVEQVDGSTQWCDAESIKFLDADALADVIHRFLDAQAGLAEIRRWENA